MNKAILLALTALTIAPVALTDASPANAHPPGWRRAYRPGPVRYRPWYAPVYRPRWGPVVIVPGPPPPVYYVAPPPPRRVVIVREEPPPAEVYEVRTEERYEEARAPEPQPAQIYQQPPQQPPAPKREAPTRDFLGVGLHVAGSTVEGEKVGISTAENPSMGGIGLHVRGRFSESFGLELSADFLSGSADDMELTQSTIPLMAGITWHLLPTSRLQPYLIAGAGVHFTRLEYFGGDYNIDITEFAGQLGGGVEFFLTENLALHADLRFQSVFKNLDTKEKIATDCISQVGTQSGFCDNIHFTDDEDKVDLGFQLSAGATWYF